jgi:hypothetical protein
MAKFRLHVDETRNTLKHVDIETDLNERELDALLTKIESNNELTCGEDLAKKLKAQNVKVTAVTPSTHNYYTNATTLEIEELKEIEKVGFMIQVKAYDLKPKDIDQAIEIMRSRMINSINSNGRQSDTTINLSQDLDTLIVAHMKKSYKDTGK